MNSMNIIAEDTPIKYISYLDFKEWLEFNYPYFIEKEVATDKWAIENEKVSIHVELRTYDKYNDDFTKNHDQFVSVGYTEKNPSHHGVSSPCDTFEEIREILDLIHKKFLSIESPQYIEKERIEQIKLF